MKRSRLLPALLLALLMLLPAGCGTQTTGAPQQTPTPTETATVSGAAGTLRVQVPDGWKYEVCPEGTLDGSETDFGVKLWPASGSNSCVQLYWSDSFGVCGTGLKEETLTLAGDSVSAGYYDGDKNWTFLSFQGKNRGIIAWADPNADWFADKGDQLLAMLDTVEWEPAAFPGRAGPCAGHHGRYSPLPDHPSPGIRRHGNAEPHCAHGPSDP